jgi:hypothetical protein
MAFCSNDRLFERPFVRMAVCSKFEKVAYPNEAGENFSATFLRMDVCSNDRFIVTYKIQIFYGLLFYSV